MQKPRLAKYYRNYRNLPGKQVKNKSQDWRKLEVPWEKPDWFDRAEIWIQNKLEAADLRAIAPIEIVKVWALAIILRVNTDRETIYFKASAPLFASETESTRILAQLYPENLPEVLATNSNRNWILMREIDGTLLENLSDISSWQTALSHWAKLQIDASQKRDFLLGLGWLDLGLAEINRQIAHFLASSPAKVWGGGEFLDILELFKLLPLLQKVETVCQELSQLGIPNTLVHGDLSPRNIYIRDIASATLRERGFVYFDWSDTCISHPFFDLIRFLYEIEKDLPHLPDARSRIRNAYLEPWTIYAPMAELISTFELVSETLVSVYEIIRSQILRDNYRHHWQWPTEADVPFYLQRLLIQVATYLHFSQKWLGEDEE